MTATSGLGDKLYVAGYDLSGDIGSLSRIGGSKAPLDFTSIEDEGMRRKGGLRDGSIEFVSYFNNTAGRAHPVFSALPTTDQVLTYGRGTTLGNISSCLVGKQINYDPTRGNDGSLTNTTQALANGYGLEWTRQMTAGIRTDTAATNGSSVDFGTGSTTFGLQAYLQVFSFSGTDVTVKLQESSDNGVGDAWADVTGGGFTQITGGAPLTQRIQTSRTLTVERYLRVVTVTTGGFTSLAFQVSVRRNKVSTVF